MGMLPRQLHAATKAKVAPLGRQSRPRHPAKAEAGIPEHAAKVRAYSNQGQGSPHGEAAKAKASPGAHC